MTNEDTNVDGLDTDPLSPGELLTEVVRGLVDHPEAVAVEERGADTSTSFLIISTHPDDISKVLGRKGATIKLLRELFGKISRVDDRQCIIEIDDPRKGGKPGSR